MIASASKLEVANEGLLKGCWHGNRRETHNLLGATVIESVFSLTVTYVHDEEQNRQATLNQLATKINLGQWQSHQKQATENFREEYYVGVSFILAVTCS